MPENSTTATQNLPEYSVSELSRALKQTVEDAYSYVRVRGEVSGFKRAGSGHLYMTLKDDSAVIDSVCWRGVAGRLSVQPEDGLEVIATGKLTTYAARSKYQLVIEALEFAGEGALLKLLEERRRKLAAEGLFDEAQKQPLPFLPEVIGVVTSPTGAVIRDILHRLADRFPRHVLLWPVLVQGETAAEQVASSIRGFNGLPSGSAVPRPDLLIVARGGGSLEDLWPFNEEIVVRAAAESRIPLISAVGHETDWTLIDHASDRRAPTPTAAAEMAVPVRGDLLAQVLDDSRRMVQGFGRYLGEQRIRLEGLGRGLPDPISTIRNHEQRLDDLGDRLARAMRSRDELRRQLTENLAARLRSPRQMLGEASERVAREDQAVQIAWCQIIRSARERNRLAVNRFTSAPVSRKIHDVHVAVVELERRAGRMAIQKLKDVESDWRRLADLLESYSFMRVLERGYSVVLDASGDPVTSAACLAPAEAVELRFSDGSADAVIHSGKRAKKKGRVSTSDRRQGNLL
ncbi:MAG: Exodeoxyribonuclease 7 large subunit [Alphaproteobacteria bacterium MarineAlpha4_Bin2]|nr:MAG: Exodeoxyribonuclease 7 large subunit [Alphaproteobacteria bacterium MarineAlpha4_Bin2]